MAQAACDPGLLLKKPDQRFVVRELGHQDFQSSQFFKDQMLGLVNGPHAALPNLVDDSVLLANDVPGLPFLHVLKDASVLRANRELVRVWKVTPWAVLHGPPQQAPPKDGRQG
jgi:hypothetical protein